VLQWAEGCAGQTAGVFRLARIDCTHNPHLGERYEVAELPAVLLFRQGRVVDRLEGNFAEFSHWLTEWTTLAAR
jgi:thioredoxin-like negative regulator of GroEL